jgi:hypothetical protein
MVLQTSAYLSDAPIYDDVIKTNNKLTDPWETWVNNVVENLGYIVSHDRFNDTKQETAIIRVISGTQARRDQLQNAPNGTIWYNTDTDRFNFRENGAWVTFTPVAA